MVKTDLESEDQVESTCHAKHGEAMEIFDKWLLASTTAGSIFIQHKYLPLSLRELATKKIWSSLKQQTLFSYANQPMAEDCWWQFQPLELIALAHEALQCYRMSGLDEIRKAVRNKKTNALCSMWWILLMWGNIGLGLAYDYNTTLNFLEGVSHRFQCWLYKGLQDKLWQP